MGLIEVVIVLAVIGVLLYLITTYLPMDAKIKQIITIVVMIVVVLWLLNVFGVLDRAHDIPIRQLDR